jgi:hypothetical protein
MAMIVHVMSAVAPLSSHIGWLVKYPTRLTSAASTVPPAIAVQRALPRTFQNSFADHALSLPIRTPASGDKPPNIAGVLTPRLHIRQVPHNRPI